MFIWNLLFRLLLVLFISCLFSVHLLHAKIYKWVDEEGQVHFSDVPHGTETEVIIDDREDEISKNGFNEDIDIEFLRKMVEDYKKLPNIQWENRYLSHVIEGAGKIIDLQYKKVSDISKVIFVFSDPKYTGYSVYWRYIIKIDFPGPKIALKYKKGDRISFKGSVKRMEFLEYDGDTLYRTFYQDHTIYCDAIKMDSP